LVYTILDKEYKATKRTAKIKRECGKNLNFHYGVNSFGFLCDWHNALSLLIHVGIYNKNAHYNIGKHSMKTLLYSNCYNLFSLFEVNVISCYSQLNNKLFTKDVKRNLKNTKVKLQLEMPKAAIALFGYIVLYI
jgi:hypothetical protein